jgi:hypothetical protein
VPFGAHLKNPEADLWIVGGQRRGHFRPVIAGVECEDAEDQMLVGYLVKLRGGGKSGMIKDMAYVYNYFDSDLELGKFIAWGLKTGVLETTLTQGVLNVEVSVDDIGTEINVYENENVNGTAFKLEQTIVQLTQDLMTAKSEAKKWRDAAVSRQSHDELRVDSLNIGVNSGGSIKEKTRIKMKEEEKDKRIKTKIFEEGLADLSYFGGLMKLFDHIDKPDYTLSELKTLIDAYAKDRGCELSDVECWVLVYIVSTGGKHAAWTRLDIHKFVKENFNKREAFKRINAGISALIEKHWLKENEQRNFVWDMRRLTPGTDFTGVHVLRMCRELDLPLKNVSF